MADETPSIFSRYYAPETFTDRWAHDPSDAMDVIIPVLHTNELWEKNLISLYREIPINRLLVGDGGCIDDSITIAEKFPRVTVLDHRAYVSLGYSLRKLIEAVDTEWFIYVHADVYLPDGWFDAMKRHRTEYDWFGCPMQHTIMVEYTIRHQDRPYAGSQMGRKAAFKHGVSMIDDDFVYRQEDFVLANIVGRAGLREGKIEDTFHYHQTMHKMSPWPRRVKSVSVDVEVSRDEDIRTWRMQGRGIIKYLNPTLPWLRNDVGLSIRRLHSLGALDWREFRQWVAATNPAWLPYISKRRPFRERCRIFLSASYHLVFG